jgi:hypothetical protein
MSGVRRSVLCCAFGRNLASVAVKMFSHLTYFMKKLYKFCAFNAMCKDNAVLLLFSTKKAISVKFEESHYASSIITLVLTLLHS